MAIINIKGAGNFYWAKEREADGKPLDTAWMRETSPPYRVGKALRIKVGSKAVHLGVCKKSKKEFARDIEKTPEEIGQWVY
jgi:hypothetical protein